jgi:hypothetical protein
MKKIFFGILLLFLNLRPSYGSLGGDMVAAEAITLNDVSAPISTDMTLEFDKKTCSFDKKTIVEKEFSSIPNIKNVKMDFEKIIEKRRITLYIKPHSTISITDIKKAQENTGCRIISHDLLNQEKPSN